MSWEKDYRKRLTKMKKSDLVDICVNQAKALKATQDKMLELHSKLRED